MTRKNIQFHATPDELIDFTNLIKEEFGFHMTLMKFYPFFLEIKEQILLNDINEKCCFIFLSKNVPKLNVSSQLAFIDNNIHQIEIYIGELTESKLDESALCCISKTKEDIKIANKIAYRLKKLTKEKGVRVIDPETKIEYKKPSHRYTSGVKELYENGVAIEACGGGNNYELGL